MTNKEPAPTPRPKVARASGSGRRPGFDLDNATGPTVEPATTGHVETAPTVTPQAPAELSRHLARPVNSDTQGERPTAGAGGGGLAMPLAALIPQVNPETDLVPVNVQLPRYLAAALDLCVATRYGGAALKREHARRALADYLPDALINEAYRAHYGHDRPQ